MTLILARFEQEYGYFRPILKAVVEKDLDCANPRCGFARIRGPRCRTEHLLTFFCKTRGFCPSCYAKRLEEWGEWARETLLLDVPHRQDHRSSEADVCGRKASAVAYVFEQVTLMAAEAAPDYFS